MCVVCMSYECNTHPPYCVPTSTKQLGSIHNSGGPASAWFEQAPAHLTLRFAKRAMDQSNLRTPSSSHLIHLTALLQAHGGVAAVTFGSLGSSSSTTSSPKAQLCESFLRRTVKREERLLLHHQITANMHSAARV